jgi:hypothetical protein
VVIFFRIEIISKQKIFADGINDILNL